MASNFGISVYRFNKILQFKLSGDFDGSSALQLLSLMRNCINETEKIIIHTDSISNYEPFGLNIFRYNLGSLIRHSKQIAFTGEKALSLIKAWPVNRRPDLQIKQESRYNYQNKTFKDHLFY